VEEGENSQEGVGEMDEVSMENNNETGSGKDKVFILPNNSLL